MFNVHAPFSSAQRTERDSSLGRSMSPPPTDRRMASGSN